MSEIRTRFAPSPTGFMHVGGVRTALFAWLIAKQADGVFILRIEDTDKAREVEGSVEHIIESLKWLGIEWQEGVDVGGEYGPYKQSERLESYNKYAKKLLDEGQVYVDHSTSEQMQTWRDQAKDQKLPFLFRKHRDEASGDNAWDGSKPLRFKIDNIIRSEWHDEVRGDLSAGEDALDDFIIMKADGYPTYNFAHIIDDNEMKVTHVVRGEEFISSMPKFLALYDALGFDRPKFVTTPPILNSNGGKKLSKRDGAKDILDYRDQGYLPEAVMNFLASMGWNDGSEQEVFSPAELLEKFSVERIQSGGAKLDDERLLWLNGHHIRDMSLEELSKQTANFWPDSAAEAESDYKQAVLGLVQERLKFFSELPELTSFFFEEPSVTLDQLSNNKVDEESAIKFLGQTVKSLEQSDFSEADLEKRLRSLVEELDTKPGLLFKTIRVAITGSEVAPGLFETLSVLGHDQSLSRLSVVLR